jgi:molybdenum-dependent DNA-binding transcriptional regulator ModE
MSTEEKVIKAKLGLLKLAEQLGNVSQACKVMGYSRVQPQSVADKTKRVKRRVFCV